MQAGAGQDRLVRMVLAAAVAAQIAGPAGAQGGLVDRVVTFSTLTYDVPEKPLYVGKGRTVLVGDGVEFGLEPEGVQNGLDVVPVMVNIGATRVEVDFSFTPPGHFVTSTFNGYLLSFETECALFLGARVDPAATNLPLAADAVSYDRTEVRINVSGLAFDRSSRIAVDLEVADCPLS